MPAPRAPTPDEFARLVREHHAAVYQSAWRVLRSTADAEDVAQQVFLEVLGGKFDAARVVDPGRVLRWRSVQAALMHVRSAGRRRKHEGVHAMEAPSTEESGSRDLETRETRLALERGLLALPQELALALELRFREQQSYDDIAEACACSATTAHERVRKGLERLRGELSRAGFAALLPDLEGALRPGIPPPVPGDLPLRLLALHAPAAASFPLLPLAAAVLLLGAGFTAWNLTRPAAVEAEPRSARELAHEPAVPRESVAQSPEAAEAPAVRSPAAGAQAEPPPAPSAAPGTRRAWITGVLVDEHGRPLGGQQVRADSRLRDGKFTRYQGRATTRADGWFRMEVELFEAQEESFVLFTGNPDYFVRDEPEVRARPGAEVRSADLVAFGEPAPPDAPYELEIEVVDPEGRALPRIPVRLSRAVANTRVRYEDWNFGWEGGGLTDETGRLTLRGKTLGEKRIAITAREQGWRAHTQRLWLEHEGRAALRVVLERGLSITGRLRGLDGRVPEHPQMYILVTPEEWHTPSFEPEGRVHFDGLDAGRHTIELQVSGYSPARFEVEAGARDVDFALKRADDLADVGSHLGELHGSVADAESGAALEIGPQDVRVERVKSLSRAEFERDEWTQVWFERPVQTMADPFAEPPVRRPEFHATGLEPGRYVLVVSAAGYAPAFVGPVEIRARELHTGLVAALARGARLGGRVLDAAGQPLARALVLLNGEGELSASAAAQAEAEIARNGARGTVWFGPGVLTDEQGGFEFAVVPPGLRFVPTVLHARHAARASAALVLAPGSVRAGLELRAGARR